MKMKADRALEAALVELLSRGDAVRLEGSGGGGPPRPPRVGNASGERPDGLEPRVAKLEAHMEHVRTDLAKLAEVPTQLAALRAKVEELPTKDWMGQHLRNWIVGVGGLLTIVTVAIRFIGPH